MTVSDYSRAGGGRQFEKIELAGDTASLLVGMHAARHDESNRVRRRSLRRPRLLPVR